MSLNNELPVTVVPIAEIRKQLRIAEIDIAEAQIRRNALRVILDIREKQELDRTRQIIAKFYA